MKFIHNLFDKLEYKIRTRLSHHPFIYALLGSVGIVVFWRGIWHTADFISEVIFYYQSQAGTINLGNLAWWDGPLSLIVGAILLLPSGLFVSSFIGNEIIISGLKGEKKFTDKTEEEIKAETGAISEIRNEVVEISHQLNDLEKELEEKR